MGLTADGAMPPPAPRVRACRPARPPARPTPPPPPLVASGPAFERLEGKDASKNG